MQDRVLGGRGTRSARHTRLAGQLLRPLLLGAMAAASMWLAATAPAFAQSGECRLVADDRNPSEKIMRCGDDLVVREARGTRYHSVDQQGKEQPKALRLDAGALMIEFHPGDTHKNFQILTPHAIAAVRGTKWVVDVGRARTSTLVISGEVAVGRPHAEPALIHKPGEGADISPGTGAIAAKRWPEESACGRSLARFGE